LPIFPVTDLTPSPRLADWLSTHQVDRGTELALHAAEEAVTEAGWQGHTFSLLVGCSRGPTGNWEAAHSDFLAGERLPLRTSPATTLGSIGFALARYFRSMELADSLSVTCSSGLHALVHGVALLQSGMAERVLVGGAEAPLTPFTLAQINRLGIYASETRTKYPCRPLDTPPTGMVLGEGAAFIALSREPSSFRQGRITGVGFSQEAAPSVTGITVTGQALQRAMQRASINLAVPDLILAHAPGTSRGDAAETKAVRQVFPDRNVPLHSLKWATGHTFGASGPLALVAGLDMLVRGTVLPIPYRTPFFPPRQPTSLLVNATGFGGNAVSVRLEI
jgi:3-oxoacyl-(acyl-carrier-protein) synthase